MAPPSHALWLPILAGLVGLACATSPFRDVPLDAGQSRLYPVPYDRVKQAAHGVVSNLNFTAEEPSEPDADTAIIVGTREREGLEEDVRLAVRRAAAGEGTVNCVVHGRPPGAPEDDRTLVYCPLILYQVELFLGL